MILSDDEAIRLGHSAGSNHLCMILIAHGEREAMAFAGGLITAARNWVAKHHGARCAYDLCQGMADEVITDALERGAS